jgi:hypothetical protein
MDCIARISIYGFISCSTSEDKAVSFANSDASKDKHATLYHIHWKEGLLGCWYLDDSAYPDEKEVLISDGYSFKVLSVTKANIQNKDLVVVKL